MATISRWSSNVQHSQSSLDRRPSDNGSLRFPSRTTVLFSFAADDGLGYFGHVAVKKVKNMFFFITISVGGVAPGTAALMLNPPSGTVRRPLGSLTGHHLRS